MASCFKWDGGKSAIGEPDLIPITYVSSDVEPCKWDALFTSAVVYQLASEIAKPLSASDGLTSYLSNQAEQEMRDARTADVHEDKSGENSPMRRFINGSSLVQSRYRKGRY